MRSHGPGRTKGALQAEVGGGGAASFRGRRASGCGGRGGNSAARRCAVKRTHRRRGAVRPGTCERGKCLHWVLGGSCD